MVSFLMCGSISWRATQLVNSLTNHVEIGYCNIEYMSIQTEYMSILESGLLKFYSCFYKPSCLCSFSQSNLHVWMM